MKKQNPTSRRRFLKGVFASSIVLGFDPIGRTWISQASAQSEHIDLPPLDGVLYTDEASLMAAADDAGHIIHHMPLAVLKPGSVADIVRIVRFARQQGLKVAVRGQGHTTFGQSQVEAGIVIDMSTLDTVHRISRNWVRVDAGIQWRTLLTETLKKGMTPPVLTDYIGLSVGGTLSVGGVSGTSYRYGVQVDQVLELQVVTGEGHLETCSLSRNRDLFESALAGLGQCGIIVRATLRLYPAEARARVFHFFYSDVHAMINDQRQLIDDGRFDYVLGEIVPAPDGGWAHFIEAVSYYTPPAEPNQDSLLAGLRYIPGSVQVEDKTYFDYADRLTSLIAFLQASGAWSRPHPWFDVFVPGSVVESYIDGVLSTLTQADLGDPFPILIFPLKTERFTRPLFRVPEEDFVFLFDILRTAPADDPVTLARMIDDNRAFFERNRDLGGTHYSIGSIPLSPQDWQRHFGSAWESLVRAKRRFDPDQVLSPGPGIFG